MSELLSFILIFAIVLTSVVLVGLVGFQAIEDYHENERLANAERAVDTFADNGNEFVRSDAVTHRSGDVRVRGGTISPGEEGTNLDVTVRDNSGGELWSWNDEYGSDDLGAFVYDSGDASETIAYVGGGVFRESDGSSAVISDPMFTCREETAMISLVKIEDDGRSIQSAQPTEFEMEHRDSTREYFDEDNDDVDSVEIEVDGGPYADGWQMYLENDEHWDDSESHWECDAERVSIDVVEIDIDYESPDDD
ncbi:DUF7289 family protein [Natrarchaeobius versutus]|uniref:DUF7289 family protein n=1 Tax=Natrarchaeobius versutus TaxID=1679078 RepID=UPI00350FA18C